MSIAIAEKRGSDPFTILEKITRNNRFTLLAADLGAPRNPVMPEECIGADNRFFKFFMRYARQGKRQEKIMETPTKPNVLFLEDDADTRELVKFSLEQAGINVISAQSVAEAWQAALAHEVDLFLLDGLIPNGDSIKLCVDLRMIEPDKPIVFYSGLAYKTDIQKGIDAGATAYLTKPYSGDLGEDILRYIQGGKSRKSIEPLFMDKESVLEEFGKKRESGREGSVRISEFPAACDRGGNIEQFGTQRPEIPLRMRNFRTMRTPGGII